MSASQLLKKVVVMVGGRGEGRGIPSQNFLLLPGGKAELPIAQRQGSAEILGLWPLKSQGVGVG